MDVRFHRLAIREYEETRAWYERRREGLGEAFTHEVDRAIARIAKSPARWPVAFVRFRTVRLRRFPYLVYYYLGKEGDHVGQAFQPDRCPCRRHRPLGRRAGALDGHPAP